MPCYSVFGFVNWFLPNSNQSHHADLQMLRCIGTYPCWWRRLLDTQHCFKEKNPIKMWAFQRVLLIWRESCRFYGSYELFFPYKRKSWGISFCVRWIEKSEWKTANFIENIASSTWRRQWKISILSSYRVSSSATRSRSGSSQSSLHSQWLSRNVSTSAMAASAPRTRDRTKPSRFSFRMTRTLLIFANSKPSSAESRKKAKENRWDSCKMNEIKKDSRLIRKKSLSLYANFHSIHSTCVPWHRSCVFFRTNWHANIVLSTRRITTVDQTPHINSSWINSFRWRKSSMQLQFMGQELLCFDSRLVSLTHFHSVRWIRKTNATKWNTTQQIIHK